MHTVRAAVRKLYVGRDPGSVRFRYGLIVFDLSTILFFISTAHLPHRPGLVLAAAWPGC